LVIRLGRQEEANELRTQREVKGDDCKQGPRVN
jgi:hypothetical protein